jgi:hypothetical protein
MIAHPLLAYSCSHSLIVLVADGNVIVAVVLVLVNSFLMLLTSVSPNASAGSQASVARR